MSALPSAASSVVVATEAAASNSHHHLFVLDLQQPSHIPLPDGLRRASIAVLDTHDPTAYHHKQVIPFAASQSNSFFPSVLALPPSTTNGNKRLVHWENQWKDSTTGISQQQRHKASVSPTAQHEDLSQLSKELLIFSPSQDLPSLPVSSSSSVHSGATAPASIPVPNLASQNGLTAAAAAAALSVAVDAGRRPSIATAASELTLADLSPSGTSSLTSHEAHLSSASPLTPLSAALSLFGSGPSPRTGAAGGAGLSLKDATSDLHTGSPLISNWSFSPSKSSSLLPPPTQHRSESPVSEMAAASKNSPSKRPSNLDIHNSNNKHAGSPVMHQQPQSRGSQSLFTDPFGNGSATAADATNGHHGRTETADSALSSALSVYSDAASGFGDTNPPTSSHGYHMGSPSHNHAQHQQHQHAGSFSGPASAGLYGGNHYTQLPPHILHRASISGPIMQHGAAAGYGPGLATLGGPGGPGSAAAASMQHAAAMGGEHAWAHGPRPHTADGMFPAFAFGAANGYGSGHSEHGAPSISSVDDQSYRKEGSNFVSLWRLRADG